MALGVANKPQLDKDNFATGIITRSEIGQGVQVTKRSRDDVDEHVYDRFEIEIAVDGRVAPINMKVFVGTQLNGKTDVIGRGKTAKSVYNRLSTLCMSLGFVTAKQLDDDDELKAIVESGEVEKKLLSLEGTKIRFKLGKVEDRPLPVPMLDTIEIVA